MSLPESRKASRVGGTEPLSAGKGMVGLVTDRGLFGVPRASRAKETTAAFDDFCIVFIMLACVLSIHLQCLLIQVLAVTAACNGMG